MGAYVDSVSNTDFAQAIRAHPAKWLARVTCRSSRTCEGWRAGDSQPTLFDAIRLAAACPRIAAAINRWADRLEAAVAIERAEAESRIKQLELELEQHRRGKR